MNIIIVLSLEIIINISGYYMFFFFISIRLIVPGRSKMIKYIGEIEKTNSYKD